MALSQASHDRLTKGLILAIEDASHEFKGAGYRMLDADRLHIDDVLVIPRLVDSLDRLFYSERD